MAAESAKRSGAAAAQDARSPGAGTRRGTQPRGGQPPGTAYPLTLELLVHGVGGATPRDMLNDPRTVRMAGDDTAGVHRSVGDQDAEDRPEDYRGTAVPEAYSWANLTSGNASRALWLLLLPFMVVNMVHWMRPCAPTPRPGPDRYYDLLVRLIALSLTVLLVAAACEATMDLVAWQCAGTERCANGKAWLGFMAAEHGGWWSLPGRRLAVASLVPMALTALLWWLSHRTWCAYESERPTLPGQTPTSEPGRRGQPALSLPGFWYGRRLVARLRAAHTAAGFLTVATALLLPALTHDRRVGDPWLEGAGWGIAGVLATLAAWALCVIDRSGRSEESADEVLDDFTVRWLPGLAFGATALAACYAAWEREGWTSHRGIPGGGVFTGIAVAQGVLVLLLACFAWRIHRARPGRATALGGMCGPSVATVACAIGGVMSAGCALRVADWLDRGATPGADGGPLTGPPVVLVWQAAAVPPVLLVLLLVFVALAFDHWRSRSRLADGISDAHPGEAEQPDRTRRIARANARAALTDRVPVLLATLAIATLLLGTVAVVGAWGFGEVPGKATGGVGVVTEFAEVAQALGSWLIGAAVLLLLDLGRRAYRNPGARRTIGILWDIGTFWPRAAHPFAPPCYAERAVPDLAWRMTSWVAAEGRALVLSGHSQGSVLAVAAAWQLEASTRAKVALLTYGSPLERLYGRYFPAYLGTEALSGLHTEVCAWRNLWRTTDPIGGPIKVPVPRGADLVDIGPLPDPASYGRTLSHPLPSPILGHHEYREVPPFAEARAALLKRLATAGADLRQEFPVPRRRPDQRI